MPLLQTRAAAVPCPPLLGDPLGAPLGADSVGGRCHAPVQSVQAMAAEGRPSPVHKGESASVQESRGQEMRTIWIYTHVHVHVTGTCTVNMYLIFRMKMHLQQQFLNWLNCFQTKYPLIKHF